MQHERQATARQCARRRLHNPNQTEGNQMKTAIPHTLQIPVLSTKHMPNRYALDHLLKGNYITGADVLGGFLEVPKLEDCCAWLLPIRKWALSNVYDWIFFSDEGDVVEGLEVYDWEAGNGAAMANDPGSFDTSQTDKRIAELRAAIEAYNEKMDDWQAN